MPKIKLKNMQTAQGMLEFALVMPVLMLIILGVFAFGHLFFSYSTIVSASREAARFGAVTGVTDQGQLRFRDCPTIRAQAVRIGAFAGVGDTVPTGGYAGNDPGVYIGYDHGPRNADGSVSTPYADCPDPGFAPYGPQSVELGDRILVRVTVQYQPIVPLIDIPSFPITATSARTIIKDLAVAAAPTAEAGCIATSIVFTAEMYPTPPTQPWDDLWVGQQLIPLITVQAADGTTPTGIVTVTDDTSQTCNFASPTNIGVTPLPCAFSYLTPTSGTPHYFTVTYQPNNATSCYFPSEAGMWMAVVKAGTVTTITGVNPEPSYVGDDVVVNFNVRAENPGAGVPTSGTGTVSDGHGRTCSDNNLRPNADGINMDGTCTIRRGWNSTGTYDLYATYSGNASYNGSTSPTVPHIVIEIVPTQVIPPTVVPSVCPRIDGGSFPSGNTFRMAATNPNANNTGGENDFTISQVRLAWPWNSPVMKLQSACVAGGNCPLSGVSIDPQPNNTLVTLAPWNSANAKLTRGSSINLDFTFNNPTLSGSYIVEVQFTDGRGRVCTAGPLTYSK